MISTWLSGILDTDWSITEAHNLYNDNYIQYVIYINKNLIYNKQMFK